MTTKTFTAEELDEGCSRAILAATTLAVDTVLSTLTQDGTITKEAADKLYQSSVSEVVGVFDFLNASIGLLPVSRFAEGETWAVRD